MQRCFNNYCNQNMRSRTAPVDSNNTIRNNLSKIRQARAE